MEQVVRHFEETFGLSIAIQTSWDYMVWREMCIHDQLIGNTTKWYMKQIKSNSTDQMIRHVCPYIQQRAMVVVLFANKL